MGRSRKRKPFEQSTIAGLLAPNNMIDSMNEVMLLVQENIPDIVGLLTADLRFQPYGTMSLEFGYEDSIASLSAQQMERANQSGAFWKSIPLPAGSIVDIWANVSDTITAGTIDVAPYIDGTKVEGLELNFTDSTGSNLRVQAPAGAFTLDEGETLDVRIDTSGISPSTANIYCIVIFQRSE